MTATPESVSLARTAAGAAYEKLATSVSAIDVSERLVLTDVFVVASGESTRQVRAIVDGIDEALHKEGVERLRREGYEGNLHWVLVDYGDLVVHVQQDEDREYYALASLWGDCPTIDVSDLEGER